MGKLHFLFSKQPSMLESKCAKEVCDCLIRKAHERTKVRSKFPMLNMLLKFCGPGNPHASRYSVISTAVIPISPHPILAKAAGSWTPVELHDSDTLPLN